MNSTDTDMDVLETWLEADPGRRVARMLDRLAKGRELWETWGYGGHEMVMGLLG